MNQIHRSLCAAWLVSLLACSSDPGTTTTSETTSESSSSSESTDATETTDTQPETETETETGANPDLDPQDCDVFAQDCADGSKCVPFGEPEFEGYKCVEIMGDGAAGEDCLSNGPTEATDDCDATGFCFGFDQDLTGGTCHPFCTGDVSNPACIDGWGCATPAQGPIFCIELCDPLAQECDAGSSCIYTTGLFACVGGSAGAQAGDACTFPTECADGLACLQGQFVTGCMADGCCSPHCSLMAGDGPCQQVDANAICEPWFMDPAPMGYEDLGVCVAI